MIVTKQKRTFISDIIKPDIVQVIQNENIELKKTGNRYTSLCPLHSEKTPSFYVYPDTQSCHCFGCGGGGDVIRLIQQMKGFTFSKALSYLKIEGSHTDNIPKPDIKLTLKRNLLKVFRQWERVYYDELALWYRTLNKHQATFKTMKQVEQFITLYNMMPIYEYHMDTLLCGDDQIKYELFMEVQSERI